MAQIQVGNSVINRTTVKAGSNTIIDLNTSCPANGVIIQVQAWSANTISNAVVGTFELVSGSTYRCIDSQFIGTITGGAVRTFAVNLKANIGCFIGMYWPASNMEMTASGNYVQSAGNKAVQDDESSYTAQTGTFSLLGTGIDYEIEIDVDAELQIGVETENNEGVVPVDVNLVEQYTPYNTQIAAGENVNLIAPLSFNGRKFVYWKILDENNVIIAWYAENNITIEIEQNVEIRAIYEHEIFVVFVEATVGPTLDIQEISFDLDAELSVV